MDNKPIYKTAAELGIKQWEHDGLVALIGPLSRDELPFDMFNSHHDESWCGTACCIGGWVDRNKGFKTWGSKNSSIGRALKRGPLHKLYYEFVEWPNSEQAARAIVNFLVTGDPQWNAVMAEP